MKIINIKEKLPPTDRYVLVHLTKDNWGEDKGQYWRVAKMTKGISEKDREAMKDCERKRTYKFGDQDGNNLVPYEFDNSGTGSFFGQEVDYWCELPSII